MAALFFAATGLVLGAESAEDPGFDRYRPLITRQPFMPKSSKQVSLGDNSAKRADLEFTGFVISGGKAMVGIYNKPAQESYLLKLGETQKGLSLSELHLDQKYVVVLYNGEPVKLDLTTMTTADAAMPVPIMPSGIPGMPSANIPGYPGMVPNQPPIISPILNPGQNVIQPAPGMQPVQPDMQRRRIIVPRHNP